MGFSIVVVSGDYSAVVMMASHFVASLVVEHRLYGSRASIVAAHGLSSCTSWALRQGRGSVVVAYKLSCFGGCGIFP